jgi:diguanylate cyclase (GGDEF)-like protein/PAS domain S-box-containing protein
VSQLAALIVEDDEVSAQILKQILITGGHSVVGIVSSGEDALAALAAADPGIVFMDISLSGELDGVETALRIRDRIDIPILFVTASGDDETVLRARFSDPIGYVIKPYTDRDIFAAITIALHKHEVDKQLREAKNFFSAVIDSLPSFVCVLDEKGTVIALNQAWREGSGVSPLGAIQLQIHDNYLALHREVADLAYPETLQFADGLAALLKSDQPSFSLEYPCPSPHGQIWYHGKVTRFCGAGPLRLVVSHEDITQHRRAEKAQHESEEKFRGFFYLSSDALILVDEDGLVVEWNPAAENITGQKRDEVLGKRYMDIHLNILKSEKKDPEYHHLIEKEFERASKTGHASFINRFLEVAITGADGTVKQFQQVVFPIPTERGYKIGSTTRDISQLKRIEQAEREQRLLAENLSSSAALINSNLKLDDVLDSILSNVEKVVPHEGADILMVDLSMQTAHTARAHFGKAFPDTFHLGNRILALDAFPLLNKMILEGRAIIVPDIKTSIDWVDDPVIDNIRSYAAAPICAHGRVLGFINLYSTQAGFFTPSHAHWLKSFADQAATGLENARLYAQVERLAEVDELTGLFNRRGLLTMGEREIDRAFRFNRPLTALFLDIDNFKRFNDAYTHAIGDQVLKLVASCCQTNMRKIDIAARYGGEEFVFLLTETDLPNGRQIAERLREEINSLRLQTDWGSLGVTVSIGAAQYSAQTTPDLAGLINLADQAVHQAKSDGRNRVVALPG